MKWNIEISDCPINPKFPVVAHQTYDNGIKKGPFYLKMEDLLEALSAEPDMAFKGPVWKPTPLLPAGTIQYATDEDERYSRVVMEIPKKQWDIRYGDDEIYTIGFPRLIIQYDIIKSPSTQRIIETKIFAVLNNKKAITEDTEIYRFPYPNVYHDGRVCWGSNHPKEIKDIMELEKMFNWFVSAPFGEDLGVKTTHGMPNFKQLIEVIQDKDFDDDWMISENMTFRELFYIK